ncbi:MAG: SGNH/GDSL hydrolase family protein [Streptosporangiaceae bacterium]|nr:SGNH/GDSL hydrolase family protein [Streptosporangiaceae bacterium]
MTAINSTGRRKSTWLIRLGLLAGTALVITAAGVTAATANESWPAAVAASNGFGGHGWVATWAASPQVGTPGTLAATGFDNQTVRNIVFTSVGGDAVRLELTNVFGTSPLQVGHVTVAEAGQGAAILPGTIHQVTFGGSASPTIPPGMQVLSDPVAMRVGALQDLAVSVYLPGQTGPATNHSDAQQVNWVSTAGDHAADQGADAFTTQTQSWYYVSDVIVRSSAARGTVVAFGDSITDGFQSTVGANARWPNDLARRLDAQSGPAEPGRGRTLAVADEGISGNRVLTSDLCCGVAAGDRFERDALNQPGVRDIILLEGINDFGFSAVPPNPLINPVTDVSAAQVIAGYKQLIAQAHARGLRIFGATLLPFQGAGYYTTAGEAKREAVNAWIRTSRAFDGVIDFDKLMRDPASPLMMNPAYDSGDHLHPNDAGYQVMANAISLRMLLEGTGI